ncbi:MAG TPA: hypothetical protein PK941_10285, partial [Paludibacter sp.]|nr:hypothetical protein [Paludibacter sp.]
MTEIQTDWVSETNRDGKTICYKSPERLIWALNIGIRLTGWSADFLGLRIFAISPSEEDMSVPSAKYLPRQP